VLVPILAAGPLAVMLLRANDAQAAAPPVLRVLLVRSATTAEHFAAVPGAQPGAYDATVDDWERRLRGLGHDVARLDDAALAAGVPPVAATPPRPVLVLPSAAALDDAAVAGLTGAVARGAGLVASWQLGVHGARGAWRGWGPLATLVGAGPIAQADLPETSALRWVTVHGGAAVTAGLPAGARLQVQPFDPPLPLASPAAVADFTRWELLPFGTYDRPIQPTAVAQARHQQGRVVWLNFEPRALVPGEQGSGWLERLVGNAVGWTAGVPLADVEPWPGGARIAAMVGLDTEQDFAVGATVADRFATAGVPLTAFAVSSLAAREPEVVRSLARAGEVGSHTDDHKPLAGRVASEQLAQLAGSRAVLSVLAGRPIVGLRPPEEQVDAATFEALAAAGYDYVAGTADKDRAVPDVHVVGERSLVVLPRIPLDDYEFTVRAPAADPAVVATAMWRDLAQLRRLGGLWLFDFHTQYANAPVLAAGLETVLALRGDADAWRATGREIAAWWRARAGATATATASGAAGAPGGTVEVRIAAGAAPLERLAVRVHLPPGTRPVVLGGDAAGVALVSLDADTVRLEVAALAAGERRVLALAAAAPGARRYLTAPACAAW